MKLAIPDLISNSYLPAVAAALISTGQVHGVEEAVARLRQVRPSIVIRPEILSVLSRFHGAQSEGLIAHV